MSDFDFAIIDTEQEQKWDLLRLRCRAIKSPALLALRSLKNSDLGSGIYG
jgi:hypothetical protein